MDSRRTGPETSRAGASSEPSIYAIRVEGSLDPSWSAWFDGLTVEPLPHGETVLVGPVRDQAALHGILAKIRDMGLPLLFLERRQRKVDEFGEK